MAPAVIATGVLIRLADAPEQLAVVKARQGYAFELEPSRSYRFTPSEAPLSSEVLVVSQAFVEFDDGSKPQRWVSYEHHGHLVPTHDDATLPLLRLAEETAADGLIDLLGDMGIAGVGISRWALMSAPHRIQLSPELEAVLAPLRRR